MTPSQKTRGQQRTRTTFPPGGGAASAHGSFSGVGRGQWDRRWACSAGPQLRKKRVPSCLCLQCNGFRSCMYPPLLSSQCPMISAPFPQIPLLIPSTHPQTRGRKMSWNCPASLLSFLFVHPWLVGAPEVCGSQVLPGKAPAHPTPAPVPVRGPEAQWAVVDSVWTGGHTVLV